tara:strand:- start:51 stop:569 length:519 start_codon:yes stop_codon:yes gene_type:complete
MVTIKKFFTKSEVKLLQTYCYNKLDANKDYVIDGQSFSPAWYDDPLINSFLYTKLSKVEAISGLKLFTTYGYWRYYVYGATLDKHTDRPACEISVTACVKKYDDWPIIVEDNSIELEEGDAVLYEGHTEKHWRPGVYTGEGMAQVFLHYVNQQGPYKNHAFDNVYKTTGKRG